MATNKHPWTEDDDVVGLYLYKYGTNDLGLTEPQILSALGRLKPSVPPISADSMRMKKQNYQFLDKGEGRLSRASQQSRRVHAHYKNVSRQDFTRRALDILRTRP